MFGFETQFELMIMMILIDSYYVILFYNIKTVSIIDIGIRKH